MRDYATVRHAFWTKGSGKKLRGDRDAQLMGLYLITSEAASITGIYYLPLPTICHHLSLDIEGARKVLQRVSEADLAHYDEEAELVWVPNLVEQEMGDSLSPADKRHKGLTRALSSIGKHRFVKDFYARYGEAYSLDMPEWIASPSEGPSEPHRSQKQIQDQMQSQKQTQCPSDGVSESVTQKVETGRGFLGAEEAWFREGVAKSTGRPCSPLNNFTREALAGAVRSHFGKLSAEDAEHAVRESAKRYTDSLRMGERMYVASYVAWMDGPSGYRFSKIKPSELEDDIDAPLPPPPMTAAANAAAATAMLDSLGGA